MAGAKDLTVREKESDFVILMKNNLFFVELVLSYHFEGESGIWEQLCTLILQVLKKQAILPGNVLKGQKKKNYGARNRRMQNFFLNAMGACQS